MMSTYRNFINEMYIQGYTPTVGEPTFRVPENFDRYNEGSGWQAYRGGNNLENGTTGVAIYLNPEGYNKEMARIWFEVNYPDHLSPLVGEASLTNRPEIKEIQKWGKRATVRWIRETDRIRRSTRQFHGVHDGHFHEWVERKPWKECFLLALQSERMKPFVKKYGVDHTKWVGMKRDTLNESGRPSKFWWMDSNGELTPVGSEQHAPVGRQILKQKFRQEIPPHQDAFQPMYSKGYVRVAFTGLMVGYILEINYNPKNPPSSLQWKALKDLAIETGATDIHDNTRGRRIRVDENKTLFESFHENKEWFIYEGSNTITAVFEDNSRQTFKLHFHEKRLGEDREKHRKKAASTWKRLAMETRKNAGLNKVGNPIIIPWQECFEKALKHPEMLEYIDDLRATPIFESYGMVSGQGLLEMTYGELRTSMKNYRSRSDLRRGTVTGADSRERGAKEVRTKSLRVVSTVSRDGQEHETSLFSYKSYPSNRDPRVQAEHPRWQGFIRFIENKQHGQKIDSPVAPVKTKQDVEVNCNCPDYMFVFAKANSDHDAGVTGADKAFKSQAGFKGGGNDNNNTMGKRIRNPENTPGMCKHLIALAEYLTTKTSQVAPTIPGKEDPSQVAPEKSKLKKTGKPINIFEDIKQFALKNPIFDVPYDD